MSSQTTSSKSSSAQQAEALVRQTGARLTQPRVRVLAFLLAQRHPLTHHEIHAALPGETLDAVTLYRVLEWLTEHNLAHRISGADQVWRFGAAPGADTGDHEHAHFQCTHCDAVTCVNEVPLPRRVKLPEGFLGQEVDFMIRGICPRCRED